MRKIQLLLFGLLALSVNCEVNQELVHGIKSLMGPEININHLAKDCDGFSGFRHFDFSINEIDSFAASSEATTYLKNPFQLSIADSLKDLRFGEKTVNLFIQNQISPSMSGVISKAFVGERVGDRIHASAVFGTTSCGMVQQVTPHTYKKCHKKLFHKKCHWVTDYIPRGFFPNELELVKNSMQLSTARNMFNEASRNTGVNSLFMNVEGLHYIESQKLKNYFPEVDYRYNGITGVLASDFTAAIQEASRNEISDSSILDKMKSISATQPASSFFYAPNDHVVYVLNVKKEDESFTILKTTFRAPNQLPGGAFAFSTGAWIIENTGRQVEPSVQKLLELFPASL